MAEEFKRLDRKLVYHGTIIDYYRDTIQVPNGNIAEWDFIGHKGAAAVVPVREDGKLLMVRQWRNALDRYTLEIPAGGLNGADEPPMLAVARELEEELKAIYAEMPKECVASVGLMRRVPFTQSIGVAGTREVRCKNWDALYDLCEKRLAAAQTAGGDRIYDGE